MFSILNGGRAMVRTSQNQSVKKKRNTRGMGSIRQKNGGYEGRITIKVNGKSKQISLFNKDKRILVQEMIKAKQEANDNEYFEKDKITLEEWLKKWIRIHKRPFVKPRTLQGYIEKIRTNIIPYLGDYYYVEYDEDTNKAEIEKLGQVNNIQVVPEFLKGMKQIMSIPKNTV